jgi:hypothetical protein
MSFETQSLCALRRFVSSSSEAICSSWRVELDFCVSPSRSLLRAFSTESFVVSAMAKSHTEPSTGFSELKRRLKKAASFLLLY